MITNTFAKVHKTQIKRSTFLRTTVHAHRKRHGFRHETMDSRLHRRLALLPHLPQRRRNPLPISSNQTWQRSRTKLQRNMVQLTSLQEPAEPKLLSKANAAHVNTRPYAADAEHELMVFQADFIDYCGDLHEPAEIKSDYLTEDPWCVYQPKTLLSDSCLSKTSTGR